MSSELRQQIEQWWSQPLPTDAEEQADPELADARYKEVTLALIAATRDKSRFPLVFAENANYGELYRSFPTPTLAWGRERG